MTKDTAATTPLIEEIHLCKYQREILSRGIEKRKEVW